MPSYERDLLAHLLFLATILLMRPLQSLSDRFVEMRVTPKKLTGSGIPN